MYQLQTWKNDSALQFLYAWAYKIGKNKQVKIDHNKHNLQKNVFTHL